MLSESGVLLQSIKAGQEVIISSKLSGVPLDKEIDILYISQIKDEDGVAHQVQVSKETIPADLGLVELNSRWTPEKSGVYSVEVFVWRVIDSNESESIVPFAEKERIVNIVVNPVYAMQSSEIPAGISLNIEKMGPRQFYRDRDVFMPTNLTIVKEENQDWEIVAWPSIGPNYVITSDDKVVFDYYQSLGIKDFSDLSFSEFARSKELSPAPAYSGRYFGFAWDRLSLDGTTAGPGDYGVYLTMPVLIGNDDPGDENRKVVVLTSEPDYFTILDEIPDYIQHNLSLKFSIDKTELETDEVFNSSLVLVNEGDEKEFFSIDNINIEPVPVENKGPDKTNEPCYPAYANGIKQEDWGKMTMYANYFLGGKSLEPDSSLDITGSGQGYAPKYPGVYQFKGVVVITIADEPIEGKSEYDVVKVSCLTLNVEPIVIKVNARVYDGVKLVLSADKQTYKQNEAVTFDLYVENTSDKPFEIKEVIPSISIKDSSGNPVSGLSYIADYSEYPVVQPHSKFSLSDSIPLVWNQTIYENGTSRPAEPGQYFIEATFVSPYLKSEVLAISIE